MLNLCVFFIFLKFELPL